MLDSNKRVIVALDDMSLSEAADMLGNLKDELGGAKVGFELLCDEGARAIMSKLGPYGVPIFMDPKLFDISATAALSAAKLTRRGAWIINLHISGCEDMMLAVRKSVDDVWEKERDQYRLTQKPLVIGVTVLTSLNYDKLAKVVFPVQAEGAIDPTAFSDERKKLEVQKIVINMAKTAAACGLDGVVASSLEAKGIRKAIAEAHPSFKIVTPGIRPASGEMNDQVRVGTPSFAIEASADWLVVGRPITQSSNPRATLQAINAEVTRALVARAGNQIQA